MTGTLLLALAIAVSDPKKSAVPGSSFALFLAFYLPAAFVILKAKFFVASWRKSWGQASPPPRAPSHLVAGDRRWDFLPRGSEYASYREQRMKGSDPLA